MRTARSIAEQFGDDVHPAREAHVKAIEEYAAERFLSEVERRAEATKEEMQRYMREHLLYGYIDANAFSERVCTLLRRILGEK